MKLSFVVPAYNEEKYIGSCLSSITNSAPDVYEIVVVNNASTDKTAEVAKAFPKVRVVLEPTKGLTYARQRGFMEAKGDILAYIDADTRISPKWYKEVKEKFAKESGLVCLSGPFYYYDLSLWQRVLTKIYWNYGAAPLDAVTGYMVSGPNFIVKKEALKKIGGFDTSISFYGEDTNIGRRLHEVGKVDYDKDLIVWSSGRRLKSEGFFKTGLVYISNYFSEVILHKPVTKKYKDHR